MHPACCLGTPTGEAATVTGGAGQAEHRTDPQASAPCQPLPADEWRSRGGGLSTQCLSTSFWTWGTDRGLARPPSAHSARGKLRRVQLACSGPEGTSEFQACLMSARLTPTRGHATTTGCYPHPSCQEQTPVWVLGGFEVCHRLFGVRVLEPTLCQASAGPPS